MKKIIFITAFFLSTSALYAQRDTTFYRHEVKASIGDAILASIFWTNNSWADKDHNEYFYINTSFAYFYRPVKWLWVGGNFINYIGSKIDYEWREYYPNGKFQDFSKSKLKYCAAIAPEIKFSFFNRKYLILYTALSGGIGFENGFDSKYQKYPEINYYYHFTCFGFAISFGKNSNFFLGGEFGAGFKGFGNVQGGYRF